jgi:hypothetical protein
LFWSIAWVVMAQKTVHSRNMEVMTLNTLAAESTLH